jgi:hypothetical protein
LTFLQDKRGKGEKVEREAGRRDGENFGRPALGVSKVFLLLKNEE